MWFAQPAKSDQDFRVSSTVLPYNLIQGPSFLIREELSEYNLK
jgi:hypothetical protein